jgi:GNAT superfamily N-acetyltransferase
MRIRPALEDDVPHLLSLIQAFSAEEPHNGLSTMTAGLLREQAFRRTPPAFSCVVADDDQGTLVGFACCWVIPSDTNSKPTVRVMGLFVPPAMRRQRIGVRLMHAVAAEAIRRGCGTVAWRTADSKLDVQHFATCLGARADPTGREYRLSAEAIQALAARSSAPTQL